MHKDFVGHAFQEKFGKNKLGMHSHNCIKDGSESEIHVYVELVTMITLKIKSWLYSAGFK